MSVTSSDIERIAALAALDVDAERLGELTRQIGAILEHVDQLRNAPVPEHSALASMSAHACPLREDEVRPDPLERKPKEMAPEFKEGLFIVPPIGRIDEG